MKSCSQYRDHLARLMLTTAAALLLGGCATQSARQANPPNSQGQISSNSELVEVDVHASNPSGGNNPWLKPNIAPKDFQENAAIVSACTPGRSLTANYPDGTSVFNDTLYDRAMEQRVAVASQRHVWTFRRTQYDRQMGFISQVIETNPALKDPRSREQIRSQHRAFVAWQKRAEEVNQAVAAQEEARRNGFKGIGFADAMKISWLAGQQRQVQIDRPRFHHDWAVHSAPDNIDRLRTNSLILEAKDKFIRNEELRAGHQLLEVMADAYQTLRKRAQHANRMDDLQAFAQAMDSRLTPCLENAQMVPDDWRRLSVMRADYDASAASTIASSRAKLVALFQQARTSAEVEQPLRQFVRAESLRSLVMADPEVSSARTRRHNELASQEERERQQREQRRIAALEKDRSDRLNELRRKAEQNIAPTAEEIIENLVDQSINSEKGRGYDAERVHRSAYVVYEKNLATSLLGLDRVSKITYDLSIANLTCKPIAAKQHCKWKIYTHVTHAFGGMKGADYKTASSGRIDEGVFHWGDYGLKSDHGGYISTSTSSGVSSNSPQSNTSADHAEESTRRSWELTRMIEDHHRRAEEEKREQAERERQRQAMQREQEQREREARRYR